MRRAIALLALALTAQAPDPVVAQSGSQTLTTSAVRRLIEGADGDTRRQLAADPQALAQVARNEVLQKQLLDEAHAKKFDAQPDVVARAARARDSVIVTSYVASLTEPPKDYPPDSEIDAAYETNKPRFLVPRQYHLQQIFVPVAQNAPAQASDDAQKALRDAKTQLTKSKADFADVAGKVAGASALDHGGDLGFMREDQLIQPVRDAVTGMAEGAVSDPVRAPDGWHLLKLLGTKAAAPADKADVRDAIGRALRDQRRQQNERALLADMQRRQPIRIDEIALSKALP